MFKRIMAISLLFLMIPAVVSSAPWLFNYPKFQADDANGDPLVGGKLYTYECGTTTNRATYPTSADAEAGTNAHTNPIILDSRGEETIYCDGCTKFVLKTSADVLIWSEDNINSEGADGPPVSYLSEYADLSAAVTALGSADTEVWLDANDSSNATVPANIAVRPVIGYVQSGTVIWNGPVA